MLTKLFQKIRKRMAHKEYRRGYDWAAANILMFKAADNTMYHLNSLLDAPEGNPPFCRGVMNALIDFKELKRKIISNQEEL